MERQLAAEEWYHGLLPREDIKMMLRKNGDFLVRTTEPKPDKARMFVLSVMQHQEREEDGIKHVIVPKSDNGKYTIGKYAMASISELVGYYLKSKESVHTTYELFLLHPIPRQSWELNHEDVELTKKLGEGAFGEVHMGTLKLRKSTNKTMKEVKVAVKLAKLEALTKEQIKEIMSEARLMRIFEHPNVVKFYGVAAGQEPLMVIMELANCGALDSYLQKQEQPMEKKNEMVMQSSWGIEYMHSKNVLHRDIASRNCLYGDGRVKIADFGLSREGTVYQMDPKKKVPIRWLAPETIRQAIYSQKTDVWSFGIMAWEIYNNGIEPYPGMMVAEVVGAVREGFRMELPANLNPAIAQIIKNKVWAESPNDRYSMADVSKHLQRTLGLTRPDIHPKKKMEGTH